MLAISETRKIEFLFLFAFIVALLNDLWIRGKESGVGTTLVLVLFIGGLYFFARLFGVLKHKKILLLLIPVGVMVLDTLFYSNTLVDIFIPKIVVLSTLVVFILATVRVESLRHLYLRHVHLFYRLDKYLNVLSGLRKKFQTEHDGERHGLSLTARVIIGIFVALPITALFVYLFARADLIFSQNLKRIFSSLTPGELVMHILFVLFLTALVMVVVGTIFSSENTLATLKERAIKNDSVIAHIILFCINAVFAIFVFIQFKYLFGNASFVFENNITFADYARHGFFELVSAALLSGLVIFAIQRSYSKLKAPLGVLVLQLLLSAQVGVVAISAIKRMNIYQEAFGYTVLRLYVEWFLYFLLVIIFVSAVVLIKRETFKAFFQMSAILSICALAVVGSINIDGIITKKNVERFMEKATINSIVDSQSLSFNENRIDLYYLDRRSFDIMPFLAMLADPILFGKLTIGEQLYFSQFIERKDSVLSGFGWYEWNIGVWRARKALFRIKNSAVYDIIKRLNSNNKAASEKKDKSLTREELKFITPCPYLLENFGLADEPVSLAKEYYCVTQEYAGKKYAVLLKKNVYGDPQFQPLLNSHKLPFYGVAEVRGENRITPKSIILTHNSFVVSTGLNDRYPMFWLSASGSIIILSYNPLLLFERQLVYDEEAQVRPFRLLELQLY